MTNFEKVQEYYKEFNENERLSKDNSGRLEFEMTMKNLKRYLPENATILDLGGATGAYSFPLAHNGYKMYLADLSVGSFIPYFSGSIAIVDRYFRHPEQVNIRNLWTCYVYWQKEINLKIV